MSRRRPTVHVVIVNYRTATMCVDALRSLAREREAVPSLAATVVDNASGDGSAERIAEALAREGWHEWVELVALDSNRGFAGGNNAAIAPLLEGAARPDYVHLLNPDTVVRPGAVPALVGYLEANPRVGIAGSRLEYPDETPQRAAFRFPSLLSEIENASQLALVSRLLARRAVAPPVPKETSSADWVSGASMMVRRSVFDDVGLLDVGYFLYFEETDFCFRARRAGWGCAYVPASRVVHFVAQSTGVTSERPSARRPGYWFDSRRRYFTRNHGAAYAVAADLVRLVGVASADLRNALLRRPSRTPPHYLADLLRHSAALGLFGTRAGS